MSADRWEHLTQHSPVFRFGVWLLTQLGAVPYAGACSQSLSFEFDAPESTLTSR